MPPAVASALKRGMLASGQYGRVLERTAFPGVAVLGYHGLREDAWPAGSMSLENLHVRRSTFESHCRLLRDTCHPISLDDWRAAIAGRRELPPRPVLITFDDGYRNVFTIGGPILARLGLPAVVFVCSEPIAARRLLWFDYIASREGEAAVERWKSADYESWRRACADAAPLVGDDDPRATMTPDDVAAFARQPGIEIGAHTARHAILARAPAAAQRRELADDRDAISSWIGRPVRAFAYPNGRRGVDYSPESIALLRELGFDMAFTIDGGFATPSQSPLERSRFLMVSDVTAPELAHRLAFTWSR